MKFFHIADLHFGKMLHNVPLTETDQAYWVEQFLQAVDTYEPDAVVIAGDIYDRRVPPPEALKLFDHLLTELSRRDRSVFVIPGNHDSTVRLSHVHELLTSHHIYIADELGPELTHVTVHAEPADVTFWLLPYLFPRLVADERVLNRDDLSTYDEAARALLDNQHIDTAACNVLVAHQNVLAGGTHPEHSESETIIGGVGEIDASAFDAFDYVALGHIHNAQQMGRETVRYAGCPLYYDFSELGRSKALTLVTINGKDDIQVEKIDIPLLHELRQFTGCLDELLAEGTALTDKDRYYIQCILTDPYVPPRALEQLREVYGDALVNVKRVITQETAADNPYLTPAADRGLNTEEQFSLFYQEQRGELPDGTQERLIRRILEQQSRRGSDWAPDVKAVPQEDSRELLDYLLEMSQGTCPHESEGQVP
ncbi:MAG: exonuclease SbcCD subunit D [Blautia sp.]|nr:exonuclease SbcCD subunit D [Blautia sp.]